MTDPSDPPRPESSRTPWLPPALVSSWREIALVVCVIIGYWILASSFQAWHGSSSRYMNELLTNDRMVRTIAMESAILGLLFVYLRWRGWKVADLRIKPTWLGTAQGLLLIGGMMAANLITVLVGFVVLYQLQSHPAGFAAFLTANAPHMAFHSVHVSWLAIIPALVLNGFFEEITCLGYAFNQFAAKRGPFFALLVIVLLRMSCHTYQGVIHTLGIGAAFLVSGLVYWKTRNLWPVILAHIIVDLLSFAAIKLLFG